VASATGTIDVLLRGRLGRADPGGADSPPAWPGGGSRAGIFETPPRVTPSVSMDVKIKPRSSSDRWRCGPPGDALWVSSGVLACLATRDDEPHDRVPASAGV